MNTDVYQAPSAELLNEGSEPFEFYVASPRKFVILFAATFGLYQLYWFYKNWSLYKKWSGDSIWPVMRAIFSIFFAHTLFRSVDDKLRRQNMAFVGTANGTATIYVALTILSGLSDRLSSHSIGSPYAEFASFLLLPLIGWMLYRAQVSINMASGDKKGAVNSALTVANYLWIALGVLFWIVVLLGLFVTAAGLDVQTS
jgi:hypothetical protein